MSGVPPAAEASINDKPYTQEDHVGTVFNLYKVGTCTVAALCLYDVFDVLDDVGYDKSEIELDEIELLTLGDVAGQFVRIDEDDYWLVEAFGRDLWLAHDRSIPLSEVARLTLMSEGEHDEEQAHVLSSEDW